MSTYIAWLGWGILALCVYNLVLARWIHNRRPQEPQMSPEREHVIARIDEILNRAAWHREQLEAETKEFLDLHGYPLNSWESIELEAVMYGVDNYSDVMQRILERKADEYK